MIEYHKCRVRSSASITSSRLRNVVEKKNSRTQVSSFSNWGKAASPEKLKHEAAVSRLCRNQPVRRVIFLDGVEDDAMIQHERAVKF